MWMANRINQEPAESTEERRSSVQRASLRKERPPILGLDEGTGPSRHFSLKGKNHSELNQLPPEMANAGFAAIAQGLLVPNAPLLLSILSPTTPGVAQWRHLITCSRCARTIRRAP